MIQNRNRQVNIVDDIVQIVVFVLFLLFSLISGLKKKNDPNVPQQKKQQPRAPQRPAPKEYSTYQSTQRQNESAQPSDAFKELEILFGKMKTEEESYTSPARVPERKPDYSSKTRTPEQESDYVPYEKTVKRAEYREYEKKEPLIKETQREGSNFTPTPEEFNYETIEPVSMEELNRRFEQAEEDALRHSYESNQDISGNSRSKGYAALLRNRGNVKDAIVMSEILRRRGANWRRA